MKKLLILALLIALSGCRGYDYGIAQLDALNQKYGTNMETYPKDTQKIDLLIDDLKNLENLELKSGKEQLELAIRYRILNLEAEKLLLQANRYGTSGYTKDGFSCKQRPLIIESMNLRNNSAQMGFEAVTVLNDFVSRYPDDALKLNLSMKNSIFLNATYYQISREARSDSSFLNSLCPQNRTLELYKEEIRDKTDYNEDFINNLTYERAVEIWKEIRKIE